MLLRMTTVLLQIRSSSVATLAVHREGYREVSILPHFLALLLLRGEGDLSPGCFTT
jgi:hypothetical protein